ncbi:MAG: endopeptidase [Gaiellaceae bacterium]|nr:endopeptidase [Gaiellaceae bacterium]
MVIEMTSLDFSHEDLARAARYHRPRYAAFGLGIALSAAVYAVLGWGPVGRALWHLVDGLGWAGAAAAWACLVVLVAEIVLLPLSYWRSLRRERAWGFSRETTRSWLGDQAKGLAVSLALTAAAWTAAVGLARAFRGWWPLPAALVLAAAVLVASFVAPVVLEPLFNRFHPLDDEDLAGELRALGEQAGVPVRDVLVADASRRTTKVNAYVSGLAGTRRVVLFDTLLAAAGRPEVKLIVAHELGHRRERHVLKGTLLAMLGVSLAVVVAWAILGTRVASPRELPIALLLFTVLEVAGLAPTAALSRRWEREADRASLDLTRDLEAFERAHVELARKNLSDLAPPKLVYLLLFSHPTPRERLALGRAWAAGS